MEKIDNMKQKFGSEGHKTLRSLQSCESKVLKVVRSKKKCAKVSGKKEWDGATCSVCMEFPHNAVLLLCSSYNKGCRPYMCATSHRYSNCLEQYKKAYTKITEIQNAQQDQSVDDFISLDATQPNEKQEVSELLCPLCRGQVKGWTVVESARKYFNAKKRSCMQDKCSFIGTYKQLRKHVRAEHPLARPRAVDPALEEKWKRLEREREHDDVISTIVSTTPGAIVLGDYVIERNPRGFYRDPQYEVDDLIEDSLFSFESLDDDDFGMRRAFVTGSAVGAGRSFHRILFGRSRRRRRHSESTGGR